MDLSMSELALLHGHAEWEADARWAEEISRWEEEDQRVLEEEDRVLEERALGPAVMGCTRQHEDMGGATKRPGLLGFGAVSRAHGDVCRATCSEIACDARRSAFAAGVAAERAVDAAVWSVELSLYEEQRRRRVAQLAAREAGAAALRAGLVPFQVVLAFQATGRVQQGERDQNRGQLNDNQVTSQADQRAACG